MRLLYSIDVDSRDHDGPACYETPRRGAFTLFSPSRTMTSGNWFVSRLTNARRDARNIFLSAITAATVSFSDDFETVRDCPNAYNQRLSQ